MAAMTLDPDATRSAAAADATRPADGGTRTAATPDGENRPGVGGTVVAHRSLENKYVEALKKIRSRLAPDCSPNTSVDDAQVVTTLYTCTATDGGQASQAEIYNGLTGEYYTPKVDLNVLQRSSATHSAWLEAVQVLERRGL